jgi:hypothetical protein
MKASKLALALSLLANLALGFLLFQQREQARLAQASFDQWQAEKSVMEAKLEGGRAHQVDPAELKLLKENEREAIRLRGEVGHLKRAVADAEKAAAAARQRNAGAANPAAAVVSEAATNAYIRVFSALHSAQLPSGHATVLGGWHADPGKTMFALVSPKLDGANPNAVSIDTKWVEIGDEALAKLDPALLSKLQGNDSNFTPSEYAALMSAFEKSENIDLLSAPRVSTISGRSAVVSVSNSRSAPDGTVAEIGPSMSLLPTIDAEDGSIRVAIQATIKMPSAEWEQLMKAAQEQETEDDAEPEKEADANQ